MNNIELPSPTDSFHGGILTDVVVFFRESGAKPADLVGAKINNNVNVLRESGFAVGAACNGTHQHIRDPHVFEHLDEATQQVSLFHDSSSVRLLQTRG